MTRTLSGEPPSPGSWMGNSVFEDKNPQFGQLGRVIPPEENFPQNGNWPRGLGVQEEPQHVHP